MSEPTPPPPPSTPPVDPPPPASGAERNSLMIVLSYLWILALIPLLTEKDDAEVQWHAKHGIVILIVEIIVWVVLTVLSFTGILACLAGIVSMFIWLGFIIVRVICIVKGVNGEKFLLPGISQYADQI